jgi:acyl carrier protein
MVMLTRGEVEKAIRDIIVQTLMLEDIPAGDLPLHEEGFLDALGANSIDTLEVLISVEEHFGFEFGDEQLRPDLLHTLDDFVTETCHRIAVGAPATPMERDASE